MNNFFKKSMKVLKKADVFGAQIKFNIDGKSTYQSSLGGLMTIAMTICIGIIFIGEIINFFAKNNINSQVYELFSATPQEVSLNQDNMLFAVGIEQLGLPSFSDRPFYNITMTQSIYNQTTFNKTFREIPLIPCTLERFKNFTAVDQQTIENIFKQATFLQYLCPPSDFDLILKGAFLSEDFRFVKVQITPCRNDSNNSYWNPVCASPQTVQDYLFKYNALRFIMYTTNYVVNAQQAVNITQMYMSEDLSFLFQVDHLSYYKPDIQNKITNVFFKNYKVETDESLYITKNNNSTNYVYRPDSSIETQNIDNLGFVYKNNMTLQQLQYLKRLSPLTLNLRADYFTTQAERKFQKIDALLSYFGGIFQIFFLGFGLLMYYYNDIHFMLRLANKLYDFKETKEIQSYHSTQLQKFSDIVQEDQKLTKGFEEHQNLNVKLSDVTNEAKIKELGFKNRSEFLIWYFEKILSKKKKLELSANYFIYILSCGRYYKHNHNKLIDKAFNKVETDMNIKHLLDQVIQVDKLKKLVLTYQQMVLFDFFPKKLLTLQEKVALNTNTITHNHGNHHQHSSPHHHGSGNQTLSLSNQIKTNVGYESFQKLLDAFEIIITTETTDETTQQINNKLVFLLGTELRSVFKASLLIEKLNQTSNDHQNNQYKNENLKNIDSNSPIIQDNAFQKQNTSLLLQQNRVEDIHLQNLIVRFKSNVADSNIQQQLDQIPNTDHKIRIKNGPYLDEK